MKVFRVLLLSFLLLCAGWTSAYASTAFNPITVNEDWDGDSSVSFSVDTGYSDIIGFVVGTNSALTFNVFVDQLASSPAPADWTGAAAVKHSTEGWRIAEYTVTQDPVSGAFSIGVEYADVPEFMFAGMTAELTGYNYAFLYYSVFETGEDGTPLNYGFTDGFKAQTFGLDSTFVAFRSGSPYVTGETSEVPLPGASILLISGILGLVGIRRRS